MAEDREVEGRAAGRLAMHDALLQRGFRRIPGRGIDAYEGPLDVEGRGVPIGLFVTDLDFVTMPLIRISERWEAPGRRLPHLGPGRILCYYAAGSVILDRHDPAGTIVQCVERAGRVLGDAIAGRSDADFGAEFGAYWGSRWMLFDLPSGYSGPATVTYPRLTPGDSPTPVLVAGASWARDRDPACRWPEREENALVVSIDTPLTVNPEGSWPPSDYGQLVDWLRWTDPDLPARLDEAIVAGKFQGAMLAIRASNGVFASRIEVPQRMRTPEFIVNRRATLPRSLGRVASEVAVERITADAADLDYVYGRNLGSRRGLAGRSIVVIGCGTIGGFLAQQLAQSGAGIGGGRLLLVDIDDLRTANLGRHLLGVPHLHLNKAEACAAFLNAMLPGAKVEWSDRNVLDVPNLQRFDLVVDATGEEALSLALNQAAIDRRPAGGAHLFVWLMGNGAIAQCLLVDGEADKACLKCLKPELAGEPLFPSLRPEVEIEFGAVEACADADFVTFPVSRSVAAAALACDLALDWANGRPGPRFRSHTFEPKKAFEVDDCSPEAIGQCPACATSR